VLGFPLIYHDGYDLNFGRHVFPTAKYRLTRRYLLENSIAGPEDFLEPHPATTAQLRTAHKAEWVHKLETGTLSYHDIVRLEVPYSRQMVKAYFLAAGGTILAAREALGKGGAVNLGGGFHHAFAGHGEGFCAVNDIAVAILSLRTEGLLRRAMVVDCDVHQGNGTAGIFAGDADTFTISLHHYNNYPAIKPPSTIDVHLDDGAGDGEYLDLLADAYEPAVRDFRPELIIYVAGSDTYYDDQLGGLSLTKAGMLERDRIVCRAAARHGCPVAVTLAGGYANQLDDTVELHAQTVVALRDALAGSA
jgi:acetoin utilization deacetylase AcuC-like enzyme